MAGFSKAYWIGLPGGYLGADGMNPIWVELLVGDSDRQWWEPHYYRDSFLHRLGHLARIIPVGPDRPATLLDATIAFFKDPFAQCPSFSQVERQLGSRTYLDFHLNQRSVPEAWASLRAEALPIFQKLYIFEGIFKELDLSAITSNTIDK